MIPVRRVQHRGQLLALLEPHEPASMVLTGSLAEVRSDIDVPVWVAGPPGGELGAAIVVKSAPGRWLASAVCWDPAAGPALADVVVRSPARTMIGECSHLERVAERWGGVCPIAMPIVVTHEGEEPAPLDGSPARAAVLEDLDAVVSIFDAYELEHLPAGAHRRAILEQLIRRHRVIVIEAEGKIVGALRAELQSRRWDYWSAYAVLPEYRGRGLSTAMAQHARMLSAASGRHGMGTIAPTNPSIPSGFPVANGAWGELSVPAAPPSTSRRIAREARRRLRSLQ